MIEEFLLQQYPGNGKRQLWRNELFRVCDSFVSSGLADAKFTKELCSGSVPKFWSCISEALIADWLRRVGHNPSPSRGGGPDFLVMDNGRKVWIEVICPEPNGVPSEWLQINFDKVTHFPHEQILLRWTSAIKEKAEKLLGDEGGTVKGYIEKGIVEPGDAYVIAVNGRQLRHGPFPALTGISQFPFAVEAVFAVGPYQIMLHRETLQQTGAGHQHRPAITKSTGALVPAYTFLDPRFNPVSAIWAVDVDGTSVIGNYEPMAVIHNPHAFNPIQVGFLPANDEYVATPKGAEEFELNRVDGSLITGGI